MNDSVLSTLVTTDQFHEGRKHVFPASQSIEWYIRHHKSNLVDCGAILIIAKRRLIDPQAFDTYVLNAGRLAAAKRTGEVA